MELIYFITTIILFVVSLILGKIVINTNKKYKSLKQEVENNYDAGSEAYLKFISDSRDWAFEYIEEVQEKLMTFSEKIEPQLNYFNTYGKAINSPHEIMLNQIDEAYSELKTILPEERKEKIGDK
jgi:predicted Holliday junction resolvase-like endonuclease